MNDAVVLICDECGKVVDSMGYLAVNVAEAEEQLRFGLREGQPDDYGIDDDDYDELDWKEKRRHNAGLAIRIRWERMAPMKRTPWRVVHERCDRNMRCTDYKITVYEIGTLEDLILKMAYLSESQRFWVATDWQTVLRRIIEETHHSVTESKEDIEEKESDNAYL